MTQIYRKKADESECESETESVTKSPCSITTFNVPNFKSDLDLDLGTDESLFGSGNNESPEKKGYDRDSDYEPEQEEVDKSKKQKHEPKKNGMVKDSNVFTLLNITLISLKVRQGQI